MLKLIVCVGLVATALAGAAAAQAISLPSSDLKDDAALPTEMAQLAKQVAATYRQPDRATYLDNLFRLQMVEGRNEAALKTLGELRALRANPGSPGSRATNVQYEVLARARVLEAEGLRFDDAFRDAFHEIVTPLDGPTSALVLRAFSGGLYPVGISLHLPLEENLTAALAKAKGSHELALADAMALLRAFQIAEAYRSFARLTPDLIAEDDNRRYVIERDVQVRTPDGATVCALVVRPRNAGPLPALLEWTIYADAPFNFSEARRTASNGYVGIEGLTRGKGCSPDRPVPIEYDGVDAAALIDWISAQPWSDGRVGMFGGSYNGFAQWAAAKHMPRALKAMMPSVSFAPGIDSPMEGNIFDNYFYPWPLYTTTNKALDAAAYGDQARWAKLNRTWYLSGRPYRDLPQIDGAPNPFFDRWLGHPSYDAYWQGVMPYKEDFAAIDIPVLTTTGYYDGGEIGALYYLNEHYKYRPDAQHYLVIGPYDHVSGQRGTVNLLGDARDTLDGLHLDPAAQIDIGELRYAWFDYVLKGGPKPAILADRINYEVAGANLWRHVGSLAEMSSSRERLYLSGRRTAGGYRLTLRPSGQVDQTIDLADRSDADRVSPASGIVNKVLDTWNGAAFISAPFASSIEVSGLFSGSLRVITNKRDFDFNVSLYERTAVGEYVSLTYYEARASYVADRTQRRLLTPDRPEVVSFTSGRLLGRQLAPGSRLVAVLSIVKRPNEQINYGTGRDVSEESIADGKVPLKVRWLAGSFIDLPIRPIPRTAAAW